MSIASLTNSETVTIQRPTATADAMGGVVRTFANVAGLVNIRCRLQENSTFENVRMGRPAEQLSGVAYFADAPAIQPEDRFAHAGKTYKVVGVHKKKWPDGSVGYTAVDFEITDETKG